MVPWHSSWKFAASFRPRLSSIITVAPEAAACTIASASPQSLFPLPFHSISNTSTAPWSYSSQFWRKSYSSSNARSRSFVRLRRNNSARTAFGSQTREKRKLKRGMRSIASSAMTHDVSIVLSTTIRFTNRSVLRRKHEQAESDRAESEESLLGALLHVRLLKMRHDFGSCLGWIVWIHNHHSAGKKMLQLAGG